MICLAIKSKGECYLVIEIPCQFIEVDARALELLVNMIVKEDVMVADIGSWVGSSALVLAQAVLPYNGSVFAIDHWRGSPQIGQESIAERVDIYNVFKQNMIELGVWHIVHPLVMDSMTASKIFKDRILDLVFIDADHRYECVKQDITSWLPKLRDGGILCGHDIFTYYSNFVEEIRNIIDNSLDQDTVYPSLGVCIHPGVTKALYDYFNDQYSIIKDSSIWCIGVRRKGER